MAGLDAIASPEYLAAPSLRWTLDGDTQVEARISADQRLIAQAVIDALPGDQFVALVLIGGYGRGEGGFITTPEGPAPFNDYDYFVVVRGNNGAGRADLRRSLQAVAHRLEPEVGVEVDFALLTTEGLKSAEPSLINAEMRWGHRIIAGDPKALKAMPRMPFHRLPAGEITRLMLNRGALLLLNQQRLRAQQATGAGFDAAEREVFFRNLFKALLACGDARLAAAGRYHPSYPEKLSRLEALSESAAESDAFMALYRLAYRHKFRPSYAELTEPSPAEWMDRVIPVWVDTLCAFEARRLGRDMGDWTRYCRTLPAKGQRSSLVRNLGVTVRDFGPFELLRRPLRALRYPRERLISALPLLLQASDGQLEPCAARALGLSSGSGWPRAVERFLALWARYA
jgi:hypothetical protein